MNRNDYEKWVNKAYDYIESVFPIVSTSDNTGKIGIGSTQFIPTTNGDIKFVFLGHDAHEGGGSDGMKLDDSIKDRFLNGNPYDKGKENRGPREWRNLSKWKIWNNLERTLARAGFTEIMSEQEGKLVIDDKVLNKSIVTNALLFNYSGKAQELNNVLHQLQKSHQIDIVKDCMKLTGELIFDVIKPKMVICTSVNLVFTPLVWNYDNSAKREYLHLNGTCKLVAKCECNGVKVLGIPHTSYPVPTAVAEFIRNEYKSII